jgi:hypothetical protein
LWKISFHCLYYFWILTWRSLSFRFSLLLLHFLSSFWIIVIIIHLFWFCNFIIAIPTIKVILFIHIISRCIRYIMLWWRFLYFWCWVINVVLIHNINCLFFWNKASLLLRILDVDIFIVDFKFRFLNFKFIIFIN